MASISNYTATGKRTWYDGNNWHTDNVTFAQLPTKDNFSGDDLLFKTTHVGSNNGWWHYNNYYALYHPGKLYKPKKYYATFELFFTKSHLETLLTSLCNMAADYREKGVYFVLNAEEDSIISFKDENNYYYFPIVVGEFGKCSGLSDQRIFEVRFKMVRTKFLPKNINFYDYTFTSIKCNVCEDGNWRTAESGVDYEILDDFAVITFGGYQHTIQEIIKRIKDYMNDFAKAKWYPMINYKDSLGWYSGYDYYISKAENYTGESKYLKTRFLTDISYSSVTLGNSAFIPPSASIPVSAYTDIKIDTTKSPNPSKAPEDEDPNDDDPGSEDNPDHDDDDDGGDGDHDDSTDPIPEDPIPEISGSTNNLITVWNPSSSQLEQLAKKLWSPDAWEAIKQYFTNPMGAILSLSIIPVAPKTTSGTIHLGGYNTEISAGRLSSDYTKFDCGSIPINRYYGSYLDYAPFTKITCTLPYIGEVDIDPDQVMQKTLSISYHINCVTGECVAYLKADNSVFATYAGNCVKQMPICQTDFSSIISGSVQIASTLITAGATAGMAGAAEKSLFGATTEATKASESLVKANSSLLGSVMSMKPSYKHSSQLGAGAGHIAPQTPFLTIIRPNLDLASNYKAFTGYPCNKKLNLSSLHGFTQIEASNLSVPSATLDELSEIKELLLKGVII